MIDEAKQDLAMQYVLGELDEQQSVRFQEELAHDEELERFVFEIHETVAEMALAPNLRTPPPRVLERVLEQIRPAESEKKVTDSSGVGGSAPAAGKIIRLNLNWVPWALAASLAIACAVLAVDRSRLGRKIIALQEQDALSQMKIATLTAQADAYAKVLAVVVWDPEKQQGILKMDQLARPAADRDYQLWIIDPSHAAPVSAGIIQVGEKGLTRAVFHPTQVIRSASQFAVSVERKGGAPAPQGPIILAGS
ncbi:MAG TPA: anti-sigma factor [Chthoniobacterales bacterium]